MMATTTTTSRAEKEVKTLVTFSIFRSFWLLYFSTRRRRNYMHQRGDNEKKVRTFGFYELACVIDMQRRFKTIYDIVL